MYSPFKRRTRKSQAVPSFFAELLERRTLLSASVVIGLVDPSEVFHAPDALINCEAVPTPASTSNPQITGTFSVYWWNGKESPDGGAEPGGSPLATATLQPFGPNGGGYVTFEDVPLSLAAAAAVGPIVDGSVYKLVFIYNGGNYPATTGGGVAEVLAGTASVAQLAFIQNPSNTAAGDTIKPPVTVAVEDGTGNITTSASDTVTLAIASGSGTLTGTVSETAVNGIATFSNLSIDKLGNYTLSATDTTTSSTTAATSSSFTITGGKLEILNAPRSATAGGPIQPDIKVELTDANGNIDTSDSTTVVTLSPIGVTSGNPISGNTATMVNGMATFPNVVLSKPGTYQLQAADGGDATSATRPFKVTGLHMAILKQPPDISAGDAVVCGSALEDAKNKVVTSNSSDYAFIDYYAMGGTTPIDGDFVQLNRGVGNLNANSPNPLIIKKPGTYYLVVFEATNGVLSTDTTEIKSKPFKVTGLHMAILKQPPNISAGDAVVCGSALEDAKNKVVTSNSSDYAFIAYYVPGSTTPIDGDFVQLNRGVGNLNANSPNPLIIKKPGTYYLVVYEATNGVLDTDTAYVKSKSFKVT